MIIGGGGGGGVGGGVAFNQSSTKPRLQTTGLGRLSGGLQPSALPLSRKGSQGEAVGETGPDKETTWSEGSV